MHVDAAAVGASAATTAIATAVDLLTPISAIAAALVADAASSDPTEPLAPTTLADLPAFAASDVTPHAAGLCSSPITTVTAAIKPTEPIACHAAYRPTAAAEPSASERSTSTPREHSRGVAYGRGRCHDHRH